ncbi:opsin-3-like [Sinocyclocheilus anshuiensis]|uniref:opsin-3-like n=1 Tax=Sinocyclocheilus anshuiensis TaxID=1608454 RepID=UPI0007B96D93|nr:PREDICTED: opsin-3-like [Sinocyclocheilus anshuiensis]
MPLEGTESDSGVCCMDYNPNVKPSAASQWCSIWQFPTMELMLVNQAPASVIQSDNKASTAGRKTKGEKLGNNECAGKCSRLYQREKEKAGIVSIMTLSGLAYERYIRVVHAKVIDFPWAWRAITHIWLYSLAWTGAPLLGWNRYTLEVHQLGCSLDWASKDPNDASFILFFLLGCFFVPVGIMAYCYGNILYTVKLLRGNTLVLLPHRPASVTEDCGCLGIVSIMTLSGLAYERYIRVVHAKVIDFPWAWRAITHIWLYSLAWTGAPLLGWNRYTLEVHQLGCSLDWASKDPNDASFILFFLLGCFFVPVGIMAYCYGNILYTVKLLRSIQDLQTVQTIKILRYEKKVAVMFLMMISCFLVCWTPYAVVSMLEAFGWKSFVSPTVAIIPSLFAKSSTAYNPVICTFMSRKFRRCMLQMLCSRLASVQHSIKDRPLARIEHPVRPIVMSQSRPNRPKKRVTFSSSSIVFIIANNDTLDITSKCNHEPDINTLKLPPSPSFVSW